MRIAEKMIHVNASLQKHTEMWSIVSLIISSSSWSEGEALGMTVHGQTSLIISSRIVIFIECIGIGISNIRWSAQ